MKGQRSGRDQRDPETALPEWMARYEEWAATGEGLARAELVRGRKRQVTLLDLTLPEDPDAHSPRGLETVPTARGERTWLFGRPYDRANVLVALHRSRAGWEASYDGVPLRTLEDFEQILRAGRAGGTGRSVWYAGRSPEGRHRFEWGFGWRMELEREQIAGDRIGFFFGDRLDQLRVVRQETPEGTSLALEVGYVHWHVEHYVIEDAREGMLHRLELRVRRDQRTGRSLVDVQGVHTRRRQNVSLELGAPVTMHQRVFHANLDPASEQLVRDHLWDPARHEDQTLSVLARLDTTRAPGEGDERRLWFVVLTPGDESGEQERMPREGECLAMVAGHIDALPNDYLLRLRLDVDRQGKLLRAATRRRQFSLREASLREAWRRDRAELVGTPLLVRLVEQRPDGEWNVSIIQAPARTAKQIMDWAEQDPDHAYVTVGRAEQGTLLVEPRPGVIGRLSTGGRPAPPSGSLCRVVVTGTGRNRRARLDVVVPGEAHYLPENGRQAHLLLKDDAFRSTDSPGRRVGFTVAGMPGLEVNDRKAVLAMRTQPPPRLGWLGLTPEGPRLRRGPVPRAGRLVEGGPKIEGLAGSRPEVAGAWPRLSYLDASPDRVLTHSRRGRWHYHDRRTGYLDGERFVATPLPDPATSDDGPLFFDEQWRLRYAASDLRAYGYGAAELLEHGLPDAEASYPVVAPSEDGGIWVELSPGRIVELRASLLHSPAQRGSALDGLGWSQFAAGDLVRLSEERDQDTGLVTVRLRDWDPGPRGWFGTSRAMLPVRRDGRGNVVLGAGATRLAWSGTEDDLSGSVWLSPENELAPYNGIVRAGDVLTVRPGANGALGVHGASDLRGRLAEDWSDMEWLRDLAGDGDSRLWPAVGRHLALRVSAVDGDVVTLRPTATTPGGDRLLGRVLGVLDGEHLLLRSGTALLRLRLADLLPGVPERHRTEVAALLQRERVPVWLVRQDGNWVSPSATRSSGTHTVAPLVAVEDGLVGVSEADRGLEWLQSRELGWVPDVDAALVLEAVRAVVPSLEVSACGGGRSSLLRTREGQRIARAVESGEELQVVPRSRVPDTGDGARRYVATVLPTPVTVVLESEDDRILGEPVLVRAEQVTGASRIIPTGEFRTPLVLSPWLVAAMRLARVDGTIDTARLATAAVERLTPFREALDGRRDVDGSTEIALVAAARPLLVDDPESAGEPWPVLCRWLTGQGRALLLAEAADHVWTDLTWEVAPALAGVLLLAEYGQRSSDPVAARLAVHGLRAVGLAASGSLHQELLLREWLLGSGERRHGAWARLSHLDLGGRTTVEGKLGDADPYVIPRSESTARFDGMLTGAQVDQLRNACRGILRSLNQPDPALPAISRSLLFAVGVCPDPHRLLDDVGTTDLLTLANLARGLTPGDGVPVAQSRLSNGQVDAVRAFLRQCVRGPVPLSLIPGQSPPLRSDTVQWVKEALNEMTLNRRQGTNR